MEETINLPLVSLDSEIRKKLDLDSRVIYSFGSEKWDLRNYISNYYNREISWLSFNYRVLQEAKDKSVSLFERIKHNDCQK